METNVENGAQMTFQKFLSLVFDASRLSLEAKADGTQWKKTSFTLRVRVHQP